MNLTWKRRFGILKSTERFEKIENKSMKNAVISFHDDFDWLENTESSWKSGFYFQNENLIRQYSFYNEQQANNEGKNTFINNSILQIQTKKEQVNSLAWHKTKGFVEKTFDYTADVMQNALAFKQQYGVFRVKLRCSGHVNHACWLASEQQMPHINLFHFDGKDIRIGFVNNQRNAGTIIQGIKREQFYVYSLEWTPEELRWYVNNILVYKVKKDIPEQALSVYFNSFIPEKGKAGTGKLEVDWIKIYQYK